MNDNILFEDEGSIRIYSVGVWNYLSGRISLLKVLALEFTPLEFETYRNSKIELWGKKLEFTPLEFETVSFFSRARQRNKLKFTPLEFETR